MQTLLSRVLSFARFIAGVFSYKKLGACQTCVKIRRRLLGVLLLLGYLWLGPGIAESLGTDVSTMLATGLSGFCVLLLLVKLHSNKA